MGFEFVKENNKTQYAGCFGLGFVDQISNIVYALWGDDLVMLRLDDVEKKLDLLLASAGKTPSTPVWMTEGDSEDAAFRCKMINRGALRAKAVEEAKYSAK